MWPLHDKRNDLVGIAGVSIAVSAVAAWCPFAAGAESYAEPEYGARIAHRATANTGMAIDLTPPSIDFEEITDHPQDTALLQARPDDTITIDVVDAKPIDAPQAKTDAAAQTTPIDTVESPSSEIADTTPIERDNRLGQAERVAIPWYRSALVSLAAVLGAILMVAALFKRFSGSTRVFGSNVLRVMCRQNLSSKQSMALVQMGRQLVFVGMTPERINVLRTVEDAEETAALLAMVKGAHPKQKSDEFDLLLKEQTGILSAELEVEASPKTDSPEKIRGARDDIKGLIERLRTYRRELTKS